MTSCFSFALTGAAAPVLAAIVLLQISTLFWAGLRRHFAGRQYFILVMVAAIWWSSAGLAELLSSSGACKILWGKLAWLGIGLLPPAWLMFTLRFSAGSADPIARKEALFIAGTAIATSSLALTNSWHGLFYLDTTLVQGPQATTFIQYTHGPLFYIAALALYGMILAALVRIFSCALSASPVYRKHYLLLAVASAVPAAGDAAYVAFGFAIFGLDPTPYLFTIPSLLLIALVASGEFFDFYSLGQKLIVESMKTPAMLFTADGRVFALNGPARKMVEAGEVEELGLLKPDNLRLLMRSGAGGVDQDADAAELIAVGGRHLRMEAIAVPEARIPRLQSEAGGQVVLLHDVTLAHQRALELERSIHEQAESIRHIKRSHDLYLEQATRDTLTGLLNRRSLGENFSRSEDQARSRGAHVTIALVDLDDFKAINDRLGHINGDRALQTFAEALRGACRGEDGIFRIGGDEFLILTVSMPEEVLEERLRSMGKGPEFRPEATGSSPVRVGFSFGVASGRSPVSLEELMAVADLKLYAAKSARGSTLPFRISAGFDAADGLSAGPVRAGRR